MLEENRNCIICSKPFKPAVHNQKCCSDKCKKEYIKIYNKNYYAKNKKEINRRRAEYLKNYYEKNKERILERNQKYYQKNKDKIMVYHKKWEAENKDKMKEYRRKRRIKKRNEIFDNYMQYLKELDDE